MKNGLHFITSLVYTVGHPHFDKRKDSNRKIPIEVKHADFSYKAFVVRSFLKKRMLEILVIFSFFCTLFQFQNS